MLIKYVYIQSSQAMLQSVPAFLAHINIPNTDTATIITNNYYCSYDMFSILTVLFKPGALQPVAGTHLVS